MLIDSRPAVSMNESSSVVELKEVSEGVLQLSMQDRVHKNTFSPQLVGSLFQAFASIRAHSTCRAVVMTGFDTYFASGGTQVGLKMLHEGKGKFSDNNLYSLALECEVPVIAAMQGHGIGGGFVFGLFADFVVLSRESVYTTNFMKYGFTPGMGATLIVPTKLGVVLGTEMLTLARTYRGDELAKRGVPLPVLPRAEVLGYSLQLAREIAEKPRRSLIALKQHLTRDVKLALPDAVAAEVAMHDITFHQPEVSDRIERLFGR